MGVSKEKGGAKKSRIEPRILLKGLPRAPNSICEFT